jgi:hypothetical protein
MSKLDDLTDMVMKHGLNDGCEAEPPASASGSALEFPMRCSLCHVNNSALVVAVKAGRMPNAFDLPDHEHPRWQCSYCGGWNYHDDPL